MYELSVVSLPLFFPLQELSAQVTYPHCTKRQAISEKQLTPQFPLLVPYIPPPTFTPSDLIFSLYPDFRSSLQKYSKNLEVIIFFLKLYRCADEFVNLTQT